MIPVREAFDHVLARCARLDVVTRPVGDALGWVTAQTVVAGEDVPPFVNSAVDGYAVRAADVADAPTELVVVGEVAAGAHTERVVGQGDAIRIMTGAPVPTGADAIVMVENTDRLDSGERVRINASAAAGVGLRRVGDDIATGTLLYPAGTVIRPAVAGVLKSVNIREIAVIRRPRVAVLSTGDELVDDGSALRPGQIRETNKTMLVGLVSEADCEVVDYGVVPDDEAVLEATLRAAAQECDAIVTSGGVSMGDYDVVKAVLSQIADMRWMQVAIKPAKPFAFGTIERVGERVGGRQIPVFGLPGNPVSSMVSFELFARPALRHMAGFAAINRPIVRAVADDGLPRSSDGKTHYVRVFVTVSDDGRFHVTSVGSQGSHQLAATSLANGMAVVGDGDGVVAGGSVDTILLSLG